MKSYFINFLICIIFINSPIYIFSYTCLTTQSGVPLKWPVPSEEVLLNTNSSPAGAGAALQSAMATWSTVAGTTFRFRYLGTTAISGATYDGKNVCSFGYLGTDGTVARNTITYYSASGQLSDSDIVFNSYYSWSATGAAGKFDVQNIATHELGHALSLADLYGAADAEKTMYGFASAGETKKRTLEPDDIAGLVSLYPFTPAVTLGLSGNPMAEAGGLATVTASLSGASAQAVTVNLSFSGTAALTSDYLHSATVITVPAGSLSGSITLTSVPDAVYEGSESIVVDISSVLNGTASGTQQVTATISDDDYAPAIITQPVAQTVTAGETSTFTVGTSGCPLFFYQWHFNGAPLSDATNNACTLVNVQPGQAGQYSVTITNAYGAANSLNAQLAVCAGPVTHFEWSPAQSNQVAGSFFPVTLTALDDGNNTATGFTGSVAFTGVQGCGATTTNLLGEQPYTNYSAGPYTVVYTNGTDGHVALAPTRSGNFVNGVWSGAVTLLQAATNIYLKAEDEMGHTGESGLLNVRQNDEAPTFTLIAATPAQVMQNEDVTITFTVSEPMSSTAVTVDSHAARYMSQSDNTYTYRYTVLNSDENGAATITVSGTDLAGNPGSASYTSALNVNKSAPMGTPELWLIGYGLTTESAAAEELKDIDGDGMPAWQEYIAGSVPTNRESVFRSFLAVSNGGPTVTWSPDLGTARVYMIEGRATLTDGSWAVPSTDSRFFRVNVRMP